MLNFLSPSLRPSGSLLNIFRSKNANAYRQFKHVFRHSLVSKQKPKNYSGTKLGFKIWSQIFDRVEKFAIRLLQKLN